MKIIKKLIKFLFGRKKSKKEKKIWDNSYAYPED